MNRERNRSRSFLPEILGSFGLTITTQISHHCQRTAQSDTRPYPAIWAVYRGAYVPLCAAVGSGQDDHHSKAENQQVSNNHGRHLRSGTHSLSC